MYREKANLACTMPANTTLNVLVLNASLKHKPKLSNTEELSNLVLKEMRTHCSIESNIVRLSDKRIDVGLDTRESAKDEWPAIAKQIKAADIILFATPIWWGGRSSLMQRFIERMDALDEEYHKTGISPTYNKVAGIVITGSEDGALHTMGTIMTVLTWMGFTLPPECATYWVGEVGQDPKGDAAKRRKNKATKRMASNLARNLVYYSQLLKLHPLTPLPAKK
jgi:multimeric flavodoxin WrbA